MKVHAFLMKCLRIIAVLAVGIVFILNFLYIADVGSNRFEIVAIQFHGIKSIFFILIIAFFLVALSLLKDSLKKIKEWHLFVALFAIYIGAGIYLICNVDHTLRADANMVSWIAENILQGSWSAFEKGGYIYQHPHQIGLVFYDALLHTICSDPGIYFFSNLGFVVGINYFIYKITDLLFGNRLINNLSILLSFAFLPQFFFILFAYGNIPGLFFMIFAFYHTLRFCRSHRTINLVLMLIGGCISICLKKTFLIGLVAMAIYLCLEMLKNFSIKRMIALVMLFVGLLLPLKILPQVFVGDEGGAPAILWIAMGTDLDNNVRAPGWYDDSSNQMYIASGYDSEIAHKKGVEKLKQNIQKMADNPLATCKFFVKKTISQWCDPLYQSLWSGPLEDCDQPTHTALLASLYTGGSAERVLTNIMKIFMLAFFGGSLIFILFYHKRCEGWELLFLMLIGGLLFHTIWEGKSQYIYPYFISLIPFVAFSASAFMEKLKIKLKKAE